MENLTPLFDFLASKLVTLLAIAAVNERITQFVKVAIAKSVKTEIDPIYKQLIAMVCGVILTVCAKIPLDANIDVPLYINYIFAGLVISFGSGALHEVLTLINGIRQDLGIKKK